MLKVVHQLAHYYSSQSLLNLDWNKNYSDRWTGSKIYLLDSVLFTNLIM